jgi:hypothetical protein
LGGRDRGGLEGAHDRDQSPVDDRPFGNLFAVSREVAAGTRNPEFGLCKKLQLTPNPRA